MATRNTKAIATLRIWFGEIGSVAGWPITYRSEYIASEFEIYQVELDHDANYQDLARYTNDVEYLSKLR